MLHCLVIVSYFQGGQICSFIAEKWGYDKLLAMIHAFGEKKTTVEVIEQELHMKPEEFDRFLRDSFARVSRGELFVYNWRIAPYSHGNLANHEPLRSRKLLLRKSEIRKLIGLTKTTGLTLVPLKVYLKDGRVKLEVGVGRGRKLHDKREAIKRKEMKREADRAMGTRRE